MNRSCRHLARAADGDRQRPQIEPRRRAPSPRKDAGPARRRPTSAGTRGGDAPATGHDGGAVAGTGAREHPP